MRERVALIGLDAAEWWLVERCVDEGLMPNLEKVLGSSHLVRLEGDSAFRAEARWAEVLTGRSLDENQYWSILDFDPATYSPWYARSCHGTYFYARPDLRSIVFDVPNSVIAEDAHGIQITGWGSHAAQFPSASQPFDVLPDIDRRFGVHEAMLSDGHHGWNNEEYLDTLQAAMDKAVRQRVEICRWLQQRDPDWDLFWVVFGETHVAGHQYLHGILEDHPLHEHPSARPARARLRRTFATIDEGLGRLLEQFDDDVTVVVFAAHGMETNRSDVLGGVLLPELLHRRAFGEPLIEFEPWTDGDPYITLPPHVLDRHYLESRMRRPAPVTETGRSGWTKRAVRRMRHHLPAAQLNTFERLYWHRPDWWQLNLRQPAPYRRRDLLAEGARFEMESSIAVSWYRSYWHRMRAFVVPSFSDCHIRLNVRGREHDGVVEPSAYDAELDALERSLRDVVDARSGETIIADAVRPRRDDPMAPIGPVPDLVVSFTNVTDIVRDPHVGIVGPSPLARMGEHSVQGWAAIWRPDGTGADHGTCRPRDLTATVVDLLGLPSSPLVTGTPLRLR
jgi:predicted AlkP superfamily phosphohydrolase/phosphomutase